MNTQEINDTQKDKKYLENIAWFWREKENIERFVDFDMEKLKKLDPILQIHWVNYKVAKSMLDSRTAEILGLNI